MVFSKGSQSMFLFNLLIFLFIYLHVNQSLLWTALQLFFSIATVQFILFYGLFSFHWNSVPSPPAPSSFFPILIQSGFTGSTINNCITKSVLVNYRSMNMTKKREKPALMPQSNYSTENQNKKNMVKLLMHSVSRFLHIPNLISRLTFPLIARVFVPLFLFLLSLSLTLLHTLAFTWRLQKRRRSCDLRKGRWHP